VEGETILIEYRWAYGVMKRLSEQADELVHANVDVILAGGTNGAMAARNATSKIPIVAARAGELAEIGLVSSLAKPRGNLTGFVAAFPDTAGKRLQMLTEIVEPAQQVAVLWNPTATNAQLELEVTRESAAVLRATLTPYNAHTLTELESALASIPASRSNVMLVLNDPFMFTFRRQIIEGAVAAALPTAYGFREFVEDGGLISYGASISDTYRRAASYIDRILNGAVPEDLPVQQPTKQELVVNLTTAKALGLTIPETLLATADEVIQ
jgi:putative tryptophan/tyrosine transport system substrate-binding protein